jgi:hypothetical protein
MGDEWQKNDVSQEISGREMKVDWRPVTVGMQVLAKNIPVGWNLQHGWTENAEIGTEVSIRHGWNNVQDGSLNDKDAEKDEDMEERGLTKSVSTKRIETMEITRNSQEIGG